MKRCQICLPDKRFKQCPQNLDSSCGMDDKERLEVLTKTEKEQTHKGDYIMTLKKA